MTFIRAELPSVGDSEIVAGIGTYAYIFDYDKILTHPTISDLASLKADVGSKDYADLVKAVGNIVLAGGEFMERLYCTMAKGDTETDSAPEIDQTGAMNKVRIQYPGNGDYLKGFLRYWKPRNIGLLVQELDRPVGELTMFFHPLRPAKLANYKLVNSKEIKDAKNAVLEFHYDLQVPFTYTGALTLDLRPVVSSFAPGTAAVAATITVTGKNFTGATAVKIGNKTATPTVINDWTLTFAIPAATTSNKISVVNPSGESALSVATLTVS